MAFVWEELATHGFGLEMTPQGLQPDPPATACGQRLLPLLVSTAI